MAYLQGLLIGLAFVAPIGMQNIYVFNNGLSYKLSRALLYTFFVLLTTSSTFYIDKQAMYRYRLNYII